MILGALRAVQGPAQPLNNAPEPRGNGLSRQTLVKPPKVAKDRKLEVLVKAVVRKDVQFAVLHARATLGMKRGSSVAGNFGQLFVNAIALAEYRERRTPPAYIIEPADARLGSKGFPAKPHDPH